MTPDQAQEIIRLRALNLSPKQIARNLGLRPAEVTAFIQTQAKTSAQDRLDRGELAPLERCLINKGAARDLLDPPERNWLGQKQREDEEKGGPGLAQVFVTRTERNQYVICSYLVD